MPVLATLVCLNVSQSMYKQISLYKQIWPLHIRSVPELTTGYSMT